MFLHFLCFLHTVQNEELWPSNSSDSDDEWKPTEQVQSIPISIQRFFVFTLFWQFAFNISNAAVNFLLRFFKIFVKALGTAYHCDDLANAADRIPIGIGTIHKLLNTHIDDFTQFVVCPKCHSVYSYADCVTKSRNGQLESKSCQHIPYPNHPQPARRKACNTLLLKRVRTKTGISLRPIKIYAYRSVKASIAVLASHTNFLEACEKWRTRHHKIPSSYLGDIYDGKVWHQFNSQSNNFLISPFCYLLTLNVDWFQPFDRGIYSLGAIYMTVQNLPRNIRHKPENVILVGIMPGPKEASHNINSYLGPLVLELQQAWTEGFTVMSPHQIPVKVRLALSCIACDIPASRKVSGFLGHCASLGCNKCFKKFEGTFGQNTDYSGYDREHWMKRTVDTHRQHVQLILKETTKTAIAAAESRFGARYSVLLSLPYFDPVQFTAIDVMHNIFLGTGKNISSVAR